MSIKYKNCLKAVALVLVAAFTLTDLSYAAPTDAVQNLFPPSPLEILLKDPAQFEAPAEFASLKEIHKGKGETFIIHIQDAHSNLSGQENLAKALDKIMEKYKVSLVLVEGGTRDDTLTSIKPLASPEVWKKVARQFLGEGKISGEEYLNLTSDHPMKIVGIEDKDAYMASLKAYAGLAEKREETLSYISKIRSATDKLKTKLYAKELLRYEKTKNKEEIDFEKSIDGLLTLAESSKENLSSFSNLQRLKVLRDKEKAIDFKLANLEQAALIEAIVKRGGGEDLSLFSRDPNSEAKDPVMTSFCHFQKTFRIAKEKKIDLTAYPNYLAYGDYLKEFTDLDHDQVFDEIEKLEDKLYFSSLTTQDSRQIRSIDRYLNLIDTAHKIQMSAPEFDLFKVNEPDFATQNTLAYLNRQLAERNFFEDIVPYQTHLETGKEALGAFYESVAQRDHEFVKNAERILKEENQQVAVLITGGYHTPHLKQLFKQKNISYAILSPRVTCETDQKRYEKILLEPLEKNTKSIQVTVGQDAATARPVPVDENEMRFGQLVTAVTRLAKTPEEKLATVVLDHKIGKGNSFGQAAARMASYGEAQGSKQFQNWVKGSTDQPISYAAGKNLKSSRHEESIFDLLISQDTKRRNEFLRKLAIFIRLGSVTLAVRHYRRALRDPDFPYIFMLDMLYFGLLAWNDFGIFTLNESEVIQPDKKSVIVKNLISFFELLRRDTVLDLKDYDLRALVNEFGLDSEKSNPPAARLAGTSFAEELFTGDIRSGDLPKGQEPTEKMWPDGAEMALFRSMQPPAWAQFKFDLAHEAALSEVIYNAMKHGEGGTLQLVAVAPDEDHNPFGSLQAVIINHNEAVIQDPNQLVEQSFKAHADHRRSGSGFRNIVEPPGQMTIDSGSAHWALKRSGEIIFFESEGLAQGDGLHTVVTRSFEGFTTPVWFPNVFEGARMAQSHSRNTEQHLKEARAQLALKNYDEALKMISNAEETALRLGHESVPVRLVLEAQDLRQEITLRIEADRNIVRKSNPYLDESTHGNRTRIHLDSAKRFLDTGNFLLAFSSAIAAIEMASEISHEDSLVRLQLEARDYLRYSGNALLLQAEDDLNARRFKSVNRLTLIVIAENERLKSSLPQLTEEAAMKRFVAWATRIREDAQKRQGERLTENSAARLAKKKQARSARRILGTQDLTQAWARVSSWVQSVLSSAKKRLAASNVSHFADLGPRPELRPELASGGALAARLAKDQIVTKISTPGVDIGWRNQWARLFGSRRANLADFNGGQAPTLASSLATRLLRSGMAGLTASLTWVKSVFISATSSLRIPISSLAELRSSAMALMSLLKDSIKAPTWLLVNPLSFWPSRVGMKGSLSDAFFPVKPKTSLAPSLAAARLAASQKLSYREEAKALLTDPLHERRRDALNRLTLPQIMPSVPRFLDERIKRLLEGEKDPVLGAFSDPYSGNRKIASDRIAEEEFYPASRLIDVLRMPEVPVQRAGDPRMPVGTKYKRAAALRDVRLTALHTLAEMTQHHSEQSAERRAKVDAQQRVLRALLQKELDRLRPSVFRKQISSRYKKYLKNLIEGPLAIDGELTLIQAMVLFWLWHSNVTSLLAGSTKRKIPEELRKSHKEADNYVPKSIQELYFLMDDPHREKFHELIRAAQESMGARLAMDHKLILIDQLPPQADSEKVLVRGTAGELEAVQEYLSSVVPGHLGISNITVIPLRPAGKSLIGGDLPEITLGKGAFTDVYRAIVTMDNGDTKEVVVKIPGGMRLDMLGVENFGAIAEDSESTARILQKAEVPNHEQSDRVLEGLPGLHMVARHKTIRNTEGDAGRLLFVIVDFVHGDDLMRAAFKTNDAGIAAIQRELTRVLLRIYDETGYYIWDVQGSMGALTPGAIRADGSPMITVTDLGAATIPVGDKAGEPTRAEIESHVAKLFSPEIRAKAATKFINRDGAEMIAGGKLVFKDEPVAARMALYSDAGDVMLEALVQMTRSAQELDLPEKVMREDVPAQTAVTFRSYRHQLISMAHAVSHRIPFFASVRGDVDGSRDEMRTAVIGHLNHEVENALSHVDKMMQLSPDYRDNVHVKNFVTALQKLHESLFDELSEVSSEIGEVPDPKVRIDRFLESYPEYFDELNGSNLNVDDLFPLNQMEAHLRGFAAEPDPERYEDLAKALWLETFPELQQLEQKLILEDQNAKAAGVIRDLENQILEIIVYLHIAANAGARMAASRVTEEDFLKALAKLSGSSRRKPTDWQQRFRRYFTGQDATLSVDDKKILAEWFFRSLRDYARSPHTWAEKDSNKVFMRADRELYRQVLLDNDYYFTSDQSYALIKLMTGWNVKPRLYSAAELEALKGVFKHFAVQFHYAVRDASESVDKGVLQNEVIKPGRLRQMKFKLINEFKKLILGTWVTSAIRSVINAALVTAVSMIFIPQPGGHYTAVFHNFVEIFSMAFVGLVFLKYVLDKFVFPRLQKRMERWADRWITLLSFPGIGYNVFREEIFRFLTGTHLEDYKKKVKVYRKISQDIAQSFGRGFRTPREDEVRLVEKSFDILFEATREVKVYSRAPWSRYRFEWVIDSIGQMVGWDPDTQKRNRSGISAREVAQHVLLEIYEEANLTPGAWDALQAKLRATVSPEYAPNENPYRILADLMEEIEKRPSLKSAERDYINEIKMSERVDADLRQMHAVQDQMRKFITPRDRILIQRRFLNEFVKDLNGTNDGNVGTADWNRHATVYGWYALYRLVDVNQKFREKKPLLPAYVRRVVMAAEDWNSKFFRKYSEPLDGELENFEVLLKAGIKEAKQNYASIDFPGETVVSTQRVTFINLQGSVQTALLRAKDHVVKDPERSAETRLVHNGETLGRSAYGYEDHFYSMTEDLMRRAASSDSRYFKVTVIVDSFDNTRTVHVENIGTKSAEAKLRMTMDAITRQLSENDPQDRVVRAQILQAAAYMGHHTHVVHLLERQVALLYSLGKPELAKKLENDLAKFDLRAATRLPQAGPPGGFGEVFDRQIYDQLRRFQQFQQAHFNELVRLALVPNHQIAGASVDPMRLEGYLDAADSLKDLYAKTIQKYQLLNPDGNYSLKDFIPDGARLAKASKRKKFEGPRVIKWAWHSQVPAGKMNAYSFVRGIENAREFIKAWYPNASPPEEWSTPEIYHDAAVELDRFLSEEGKKFMAGANRINGPGQPTTGGYRLLREEIEKLNRLLAPSSDAQSQEPLYRDGEAEKDWSAYVETLLKKDFQETFQAFYYKTVAEVFFELAAVKRPFKRNNQYTALLLANMMLLKAGFTPFLLGENNVEGYIEAYTSPANERVEKLANLIERSVTIVRPELLGATEESSSLTSLNKKSADQITVEDILKPLESSGEVDNNFGLSSEDDRILINFESDRTSYVVSYLYRAALLAEEDDPVIKINIRRLVGGQGEARPQEISLYPKYPDDRATLKQLLQAMSRVAGRRFQTILDDASQSKAGLEKYAGSARRWGKMVRVSIPDEEDTVRNELSRSHKAFDSQLLSKAAQIGSQRRAQRTQTSTVTTKKPSKAKAKPKTRDGARLAEIVPAEESDMSGILDVWEQEVAYEMFDVHRVPSRDSMEKNIFLKILRDKKAWKRIFVAKDREGVEGYVIAGFNSPDNDFAWIYEIAVRQASQGEGIERKLIDRALDWLQENPKISFVNVEFAFTPPQTIQEAYEDLGFEATPQGFQFYFPAKRDGPHRAEVSNEGARMAKKKRSPVRPVAKSVLQAASQEIEIFGDGVTTTIVRGKLATLSQASSEEIAFAVPEGRMEEALVVLDEFGESLEDVFRQTKSDERREFKAAYINGKISAVKTRLDAKQASGRPTNPLAMLIDLINEDLRSLSAAKPDIGGLDSEDLRKVLEATQLYSHYFTPLYHIDATRAEKEQAIRQEIATARVVLNKTKEKYERLIREAKAREAKHPRRKMVEEVKAMEAEISGLLSKRLKSGKKLLSKDSRRLRQLEGIVVELKKTLASELPSVVLNNFLALAQGIELLYLDESQEQKLIEKLEGKDLPGFHRKHGTGVSFASVIYREILIPKGDLYESRLQEIKALKQQLANKMIPLADRREIEKRLPGQISLTNSIHDMVNTGKSFLAEHVSLRNGQKVEPYHLDADETEEGIIIFLDTPIDVTTYLQLHSKYGDRLKGIISTQATVGSHWVIVSQSSPNPPAILLVSDEVAVEKLQSVPVGADIIISDHEQKKKSAAYLFPTPGRLEAIKLEEERQRLESEMADSEKNKYSIVSLSANMTPHDPEDAVQKFLPEGSGLVRTEVWDEVMAGEMEGFLDFFVQSPEFAESLLLDYLTTHYREMMSFRSFIGQKITFRTFDIQGDKNAAFIAKLEKLFGDDAFKPGFDFYRTRVGERMLAVQIAALNLAHASLPYAERAPELRIMFPLVNSAKDLRKVADEIIPIAQNRIDENSGAPAPSKAVYGAMIETPEAVDNINEILNDSLIGFVSVGTNDLTQSIMEKELFDGKVTISRDLPAYEHIFSQLQKPVLLALRRVANAVAQHNLNRRSGQPAVDLGICGEIAGSDKFLLFAEYLRLTYGIPVYLSMSANRIPMARLILRLVESPKNKDLLKNLFGRTIDEENVDRLTEKAADDLLVRSDIYQKKVEANLPKRKAKTTASAARMAFRFNFNEPQDFGLAPPRTSAAEEKFRFRTYAVSIGILVVGGWLKNFWMLGLAALIFFIPNILKWYALNLLEDKETLATSSQLIHSAKSLARAISLYGQEGASAADLLAESKKGELFQFLMNEFESHEPGKVPVMPRFESRSIRLVDRLFAIGTLIAPMIFSITIQSLQKGLDHKKDKAQISRDLALIDKIASGLTNYEPGDKSFGDIRLHAAEYLRIRAGFNVETEFRSLGARMALASAGDEFISKRSAIEWLATQIALAAAQSLSDEHRAMANWALGNGWQLLIVPGLLTDVIAHYISEAKDSPQPNPVENWHQAEAIKDSAEKLVKRLIRKEILRARRITRRSQGAYSLNSLDSKKLKESQSFLDTKGIQTWHTQHGDSDHGGDLLKVSGNARFTLIEVADGVGNGRHASPAWLLLKFINDAEEGMGKLLVQAISDLGGVEAPGAEELIRSYFNGLNDQVNEYRENGGDAHFSTFTYGFAMIEHETGNVYEFSAGHPRIVRLDAQAGWVNAEHSDKRAGFFFGVAERIQHSDSLGEVLTPISGTQMLVAMTDGVTDYIDGHDLAKTLEQRFADAGSLTPDERRVRLREVMNEVTSDILKPERKANTDLTWVTVDLKKSAARMAGALQPMGLLTRGILDLTPGEYFKIRTEGLQSSDNSGVTKSRTQVSPDKVSLALSTDRLFLSSSLRLYGPLRSPQHVVFVIGKDYAKKHTKDLKPVGRELWKPRYKLGLKKLGLIAPPKDENKDNFSDEILASGISAKAITSLIVHPDMVETILRWDDEFGFDHLPIYPFSDSNNRSTELAPYNTAARMAVENREQKADSGEQEQKSSVARLAIADEFRKFGIEITSSGLDFSKVPADAEWVMREIRSIKKKLIVQSAAEAPEIKLTYPLEEFPQYGSDSTNSAGVYLAVARIGNSDRPVIVKLFDKQFNNEVRLAQAFDRLGIGPHFYGSIKDDTGKPIGYVMEVVLGDFQDSNDVGVDYSGHPDIDIIDDRTYLAGITPPTDYILTSGIRLIGIDAGNSRILSNERYEAFVKENNSTSGARLSNHFLKLNNAPGFDYQLLPDLAKVFASKDEALFLSRLAAVQFAGKERVTPYLFFEKETGLLKFDSSKGVVSVTLFRSSVEQNDVVPVARHEFTETELEVGREANQISRAEQETLAKQIAFSEEAEALRAISDEEARVRSLERSIAELIAGNAVIVDDTKVSFKIVNLDALLRGRSEAYIKAYVEKFKTIRRRTGQYFHFLSENEDLLKQFESDPLPLDGSVKFMYLSSFREGESEKDYDIYEEMSAFLPEDQVKMLENLRVGFIPIGAEQGMLPLAGAIRFTDFVAKINFSDSNFVGTAEPLRQLMTNLMGRDAEKNLFTQETLKALHTFSPTFKQYARLAIRPVPLDYRALGAYLRMLTQVDVMA